MPHSIHTGRRYLGTPTPSTPPVKKWRFWPLFASAIFADQNKVRIRDSSRNRPGGGTAGQIAGRKPKKRGNVSLLHFDSATGVGPHY